jgi:hypothetical protein
MDIASALSHVVPLLEHLQELRTPQNSRLAELSKRLRRSANGHKGKGKQKPANNKHQQKAEVEKLRICDPFPESGSWRELRRVGFAGASAVKGPESIVNEGCDMVCSCPPAAALEKLVKLLPQWQANGRPFVLFLPATLAARPLWKDLLLKQTRLADSMCYVVPPEGSKIWFIGGWAEMKSIKSARGALIHAAVGRKSSGEEFCKIADSVERLEELGCLSGEGGAEGTTKCRIDYLFSKTPEILRKELHLDQTATFSGIVIAKHIHRVEVICVVFFLPSDDFTSDG